MENAKAGAAPEPVGIGSDPDAVAAVTKGEVKVRRRRLAGAGTWLLHGCAAAAGYHAAHYYADIDVEVEDSGR